MRCDQYFKINKVIEFEKNCYFYFLKNSFFIFKKYFTKQKLNIQQFANFWIKKAALVYM